MFVAIVRFPSIKPEQDNEFREWFNWSTQLLKKSPGFISRRLLAGKDQDYVAIVEHSRYDTFMAMLQQMNTGWFMKKLYHYSMERPKWNYSKR